MKVILSEFKKVIVLGVIFLLILLLMDFNNRVSDMFHLSEEVERMGATATVLTQTQSQYRTRIAYATSEPAVREWARQNHMAQEGDNPIVPLPPPGFTPTPQVIAEPLPTPMSNWQIWMALFFE